MTKTWIASKCLIRYQHGLVGLQKLEEDLLAGVPCSILPLEKRFSVGLLENVGRSEAL